MAASMCLQVPSPLGKLCKPRIAKAQAVSLLRLPSAPAEAGSEASSCLAATVKASAGKHFYQLLHAAAIAASKICIYLPRASML